MYHEKVTGDGGHASGLRDEEQHLHPYTKATGDEDAPR